MKGNKQNFIVRTGEENTPEALHNECHEWMRRPKKNEGKGTAKKHCNEQNVHPIAELSQQSTNSELISPSYARQKQLGQLLYL